MHRAKTDQAIDMSFIGSFKLGDNIAFNIRILKSLYCNLDANLPINIKPIILITISVIEALMFDFVKLVKLHTREFKYLDEEKRSAIRRLDTDKNRWNFNTTIKKLTHFKILGNQSNYFAKIQFLRNLSNRIHIQNQFF